MRLMDILTTRIDVVGSFTSCLTMSICNHIGINNKNMIRAAANDYFHYCLIYGLFVV